MKIVKDGDVCVPEKRSQTTDAPAATTLATITTTTTVSLSLAKNSCYSIAYT